MITGAVIWEKIGLQIVSICIMKAKGHVYTKIKRGKQKQYKKDFINKLDLNLLNKYGSRTFYNKLTICLCAKNNLEKIYNRCYQRDLNDYSIDEEIIEEIISSEDWIPYEIAEVKLILHHIILTSFSVLNNPKTDSERRIINVQMNNFGEITNDFKNVNQLIKGLSNKIDTLTNVSFNCESIPNGAVLNLINNGKYNITLAAKEKESHFIISVWIKYTDEILKFQNGYQFLSYLNFCGKTTTVDVVYLEITDNDGTIIQTYGKKDVDCPILKLAKFFVPSIDISSHMFDGNSDLIKLQIMPSLSTFEIDIENDEGEKVVSNLKQSITREILPSGELKVTLQDLRKNKKVLIQIVNIFQNNQIVNTSISISAVNPEDVQSSMAYYILMKKLFLTKNIIYRYSDSGKKFGQSNGISCDVTLEDIEANISLYKKIIKIQDFFKVKISLPKQICQDDVEWCNRLCILMDSGYVKFENYQLSILKEGVDNTQLNDLTNRNSDYLLQANFSYIEIFNCRINFDDDLLLVFPKSYIKEQTDDEIVIGCKTPSILAYRGSYKDFNIYDIANKIIAEAI